MDTQLVYPLVPLLLEFPKTSNISDLLFHRLQELFAHVEFSYGERIGKL
jgi:hypothetical protein